MSFSINLDTFDVLLDGVPVGSVVESMTFQEEMFLLVPYLQMSIKSSLDYTNTINIKKGSSLDINIKPNEPIKNAITEKYNQTDSVKFTVMDFQLEHNARTTESSIVIFATLNGVDELFNTKKHKYWNEPTSSILSSMFNNISKSSNVIPSNDKMKHIQWFESDIEFANRIIKSSYFSEADYLSHWVSRNKNYRLTNFNNLIGGVDFVIDTNSSAIDYITNPYEAETDSHERASTVDMIPCLGVKLNQLFGSSAHLGASGTVLTSFDQFSSIANTSLINVKGFTAPSMGDYIPIVDSDYSKPSAFKNVPPDSNGITHLNFQRSTVENGIFWQMLTTNVVELTIPYKTIIQVGQSFKIDIDTPSDDEDRDAIVKSNFLRNCKFVVYTLVHSYSEDDKRMWTKIYGVTFGLNKNYDEQNFRYVTNS